MSLYLDTSSTSLLLIALFPSPNILYKPLSPLKSSKYNFCRLGLALTFISLQASSFSSSVDLFEYKTFNDSKNLDTLFFSSSLSLSIFFPTCCSKLSISFFFCDSVTSSDFSIPSNSLALSAFCDNLETLGFSSSFSLSTFFFVTLATSASEASFFTKL